MYPQASYLILASSSSINRIEDNFDHIKKIAETQILFLKQHHRTEFPFLLVYREDHILALSALSEFSIFSFLIFIIFDISHYKTWIEFIN